jgi:uncharacterized membrane protein YphA (DoxX/SURF4 family)
MFYTFPDGSPGAGLLLLRAAGGLGLIVQGTTYFLHKHDLGMLILIVAVLTVSIGALLLIGCLTRVAAVAALVASVVSMLPWFPALHAGFSETRMTALLAVSIAAALACLGPGAFSVDARLFGPREIIIPKSFLNKQI